MERPKPVTAVAWIFILVGCAGLLNDLWPLATSGAAEHLSKLRADGWSDLGPAWTLRALAIVGGVGLLRGQNWARWLLAAWMITHIGISLFHNVVEVMMHTVIFALLAYSLFRPSADPYFHARTGSAA
jgi:hypothetical protein